jgi:hypothetical protein
MIEVFFSASNAVASRMLTPAVSATLVALRPGSLNRDSITARTFSSATDRAEEMHGLSAPLAFSRDTAIKSRIWFLGDLLGVRKGLSAFRR